MIHLDFETFSEQDISSGGAWKYSTHPSTEILCMAFAIDDEPVELWTPDNGYDLGKLFALISEGALIEAHNAFFERCIWQNVAVSKLGFPQVNSSQWRCSAARVASIALPRSLKNAAAVLGCINQKDTEGGSTMLKLCKPKNATKKDPSTRYSKAEYPEMYETLYAYCKQDVETEREITKLTRPLIEFEQELWLLDQEINARGVPIDKEAVEIAFNLGLEFTRTALDRVTTLTNGVVGSFRQVGACVKWAKEQGYELESFGKEYLENKMKDSSMPANVRELINIRQQSAKTSTAKYEAMLGCISEDNRIRDNYMYHGASTGRWSGKNVQFQNLPRGKIKDMDTAVDMLKLGSSEMIEACYDTGIMDFLSSAIRGMIVAPEGKQLYVADYASIEARGVAWISGQDDLLNDFRSGGKIYEKQAAFTYGKPIEEIGKESIERQVGKTLVLACGYGMGASKFQMTCASQKIELDLDFCEKAVKSYRGKNPMIVSQWYAQENAAMLAVRTGRPIPEGKVTWFVHGDFLYCKLPSKRCLAYYKPNIKESTTSWGSVKEQLHITGEKTVETRKVWCEYSVYGGLLVENIVQAISRDLVAYGMIAVQKTGYDVIMHAHDELIAEAPLGFGSIEEYEHLMCSTPEWAEGFPIKSEGWVGKRYKK
jgi:DNA polymerase